MSLRCSRNCPPLHWLVYVDTLTQVDLPGHANGLLPLKHYGGRFCAPSQMYADQGGGTVRVLTGLVEEYAALFGSQVRYTCQRVSYGMSVLNGLVHIRRFFIWDVMKQL